MFYQALDSKNEIGYWSVPVTGGTPPLVLRLDDTPRTTRRPEFATDGKRIYFTVAADESDVWLLELKR